MRVYPTLKALLAAMDVVDVAAQVATATDADHADIRQVAEAMIATAERRGGLPGPSA